MAVVRGEQDVFNLVVVVLESLEHGGVPVDGAVEDAVQQSGGGCIGGGVEQVKLVVDALALFVANECEGVAGAGEEVQFAEAHFFFFVEVDGGADDGEEGVAVSF